MTANFHDGRAPQEMHAGTKLRNRGEKICRSSGGVEARHLQNGGLAVIYQDVVPGGIARLMGGA